MEKNKKTSIIRLINKKNIQFILLEERKISVVCSQVPINK